ncbi:MAG: hypothetical protein ABL984_15710 [Pyrinomonadaceae bacterium]
MNRILLLISLAAVLCSTAVAQKPIREWPFEGLSDFVNDYNKRRNGERLVVRDAPVPAKVIYEKAYAMYSFKPDEDGDVGKTFFTSPALAKALRPHLKDGTANLWITCTLIEFAGEFDTYRSPFATKIEGLNAVGETIWTVTGPPPARTKVRQ